MKTAIVTVPKASLYETALAGAVSDELLSGWVVEVRQSWGDCLEITTHYGYSGWVNASAVRSLLPEERCLWDGGSPNPAGRETCQKGCSVNTSIQAGKGSFSPAIICHNIIDVLECPTVQARALSTLFMGSTVVPLGAQEEGWQRIQLADCQCGYVPACMLLTPADIKYSQIKYSQESLRHAILEYALSFLGTPYRWGGKTREGIDCSGLAFMSYYMCGILIYRDAVLAEGYPVHAIPLSQAKPADLLYFPSHIALYLGEGKYIHSTGNIHSFGCIINSLNPDDPDYRADLAGCIKGAGSIF